MAAIQNSKMWGIEFTSLSEQVDTKVLIVKAGTTVVWKNTDVGMPHSVRGVHGEFLSPMLQPGDTYSVRFDHRGEIHYTCTPHPWMKGAIIVR